MLIAKTKMKKDEKKMKKSKKRFQMSKTVLTV